MFKKLTRWIKSPFRVSVTNQPWEPEIVSMCPFRGDVLIAMRDGSIYMARDNLQDGYPTFQKITTLRCI